MTTYQEPPLQSRRAARQGERAEAAETISTNDESVARAIAAGTAEPLIYATTSRPPLPQYDGQNLRPRRTVESPDHADLPPTVDLPDHDASFRSRDFSPEGRRAASSWAPQFGGVGDDGIVEFQTQGRNAPAAAVPVSDAPAEAMQVDAAAAGHEAQPSDATPTPVALSPAEHTMTRRELRALREAGLITDVTDLSQPIDLPQARQHAEVVPESVPELTPEAESAPEAEAQLEAAPDAQPVAEIAAAVTAMAEPIPLVAPAPQPSSRLDSALAEFDALAAGREPLVPAADAPLPLPGRRAAAPAQTIGAAAVVPEVEATFDALPEPSVAPPAPVDGLSAFDALFQPPSAAVPIVVALPVDQAVSHDDVIEAEIVGPELGDPLLSAPAPQGAPVAVAHIPPMPQTPQPAAGEPAVGHWSTQADIDDAEQLNESTISRSVGVGNGAITTSALVLPSIPDHSIGGPMGDTGQILLTGSISLPDSMSMTGALPSQLDEVDIDHLLDPGDQQVASTDSTPVRAIRAVSTHTASGGIISPVKPKGTRGFTILIVAASVMVLVVVGLLVLSLVTGKL